MPSFLCVNYSAAVMGPSSDHGSAPLARLADEPRRQLVNERDFYHGLVGHIGVASIQITLSLALRAHKLALRQRFQGPRRTGALDDVALEPPPDRLLVLWQQSLGAITPVPRSSSRRAIVQIRPL